MCEEACPKSAIYLTDRLVDVETNRGSFIYGKDKLVEKINERIDITQDNPRNKKMR
jgi:NADH-quinone oxidoreductase subunit I